MEEFFKNLPIQKIINSIIVILIASLLYLILRHPAKRILGLQKSNRSSTFLSMIGSFFRTIYFVVVVLIILQINGVDVSSLIAGLGIASVIIGLAVQDTLKDVIRGVGIISDDYYEVGETVTIGDVTGKVLSVGIRSTKISDASTGNIVTIANRNIERASKAGTKFGIIVPLPYELKLSKAEAIMNEIAEKANELDDIEKLNYVGVEEFGESAIEYKLFGSSNPKRRIQAKRAVRHLVLEVLEEHKISIPYPQIDVHQKKD
jgi:small conductance mechanosensitive channel